MSNEKEEKKAPKKDDWTSNPNTAMPIQKGDDSWKANNKMVMTFQESFNDAKKKKDTKEKEDTKKQE